MTTRLLNMGEVLALLGISRYTLWSWRRKGIFPRPLRLPHTARWREADVEAWMAKRAKP